MHFISELIHLSRNYKTSCASFRPDWQAEALCSSACLSLCTVGTFINLSCICSFIGYQTCEHNILKTNEQMLMQIGTIGPRINFGRSGGQRSRSHGTEVGHKKTYSTQGAPSAFKSNLGLLWPWLLTSWSPKLIVLCSYPVDHLCQSVSKWVYLFSKYFVHKFDNEQMDKRISKKHCASSQSINQLASADWLDT